MKFETYSRAIGFAGQVHRVAARGVVERDAVAVDHEPRLARLAGLAAEPVGRHEVERPARLERLGQQRELLLLAEARLDARRAGHPLHQRFEGRRRLALRGSPRPLQREPAPRRAARSRRATTDRRKTGRILTRAARSRPASRDCDGESAGDRIARTSGHAHSGKRQSRRVRGDLDAPPAVRPWRVVLRGLGFATFGLIALWLGLRVSAAAAARGALARERSTGCARSTRSTAACASGCAGWACARS